MIELALLLASAIGAGYADGADVRGPRPAPEVRTALASVRPALEVCATSSPSDLFVDVEILAAGFVDRAESFASAGTLDDSCVKNALRTMAFQDRGIEPATHVIVHLASRDGESEPHPTPREIARALEIHSDDVARCVAVGRRVEPMLAGSIVLMFVISGDGPSSVRVSGGSLQSAEVHACITRELDGLRFKGVRDPVEGEAVVAWPLFFAKPAPVPSRPRPRARSAWDEPTLVDFLGCGTAFPTS